MSILFTAGSAVDDFIKQLTPLLSPGDIIIDGGNSEYQDTARRVEECKKHKLLFVGSGVSGGEEGARYGPSLMPGGNPEAWPHIKDIFQSICAKSGSDPCCEWVSFGFDFIFIPRGWLLHISFISLGIPQGYTPGCTPIGIVQEVPHWYALEVPLGCIPWKYH